MARVLAVDRSQRVEFHAVELELLEPRQDAVEGGLFPLVDPVGVVQLARAVDADSHQELIFRQELGPLVIDQNAIRLEGVSHGLASCKALLQGDHFAEEPDPEEGRFASLPGKARLGPRLRSDVVPDVGFQNFRGHAKAPGSLVQLGFLEVETIAAFQVAQRADGLRHRVGRGPRLSVGK